MFRTLLMTALLSAATVGTMAQATAEDCGAPETQFQINACAKLDWQAEDRRLNKAYAQARTAMQQIDADLPNDPAGAANTLRDAQRAWIKFRDAACAAEGFLARGGSMEPMFVWTCMATLTRRRSEDLLGLVEIK